MRVMQQMAVVVWLCYMQRTVSGHILLDKGMQLKNGDFFKDVLAIPIYGARLLSCVAIRYCYSILRYLIGKASGCIHRTYINVSHLMPDHML